MGRVVTRCRRELFFYSVTLLHCKADRCSLLIIHSQPDSEGRNALMAVVCLSVCPVPGPKSSTEGFRKLKVVREEADNTGDP